MISPLANNTLTEHAYRTILDSFVRGELKPGERLKVDEMAERLGISPTPLRQALVRLQAEGVVHWEPRRGLYVALLTAADLADLCELRLLYETFAMDKVIATATVIQTERLLQLVEEYAAVRGRDEPADRLAWVRKDVELHQYLVDLAGNRKISASFGTLGIHFQTLRFTMVVERAPGETIREHREIWQAFAARDGARTRALLTKHIQASCDRFTQALKREPAPTPVEDEL